MNYLLEMRTMVELSLIGIVGILSIEVLSVWVGLGVLVSGIIYGTIMVRQGASIRREEKRVTQILEVEHQTKLKGEQVKLEIGRVELKSSEAKLEREQVELKSSEVKLEREQVELKSSEAKSEREQVESEKQQLRITVLEANLEKVNIEIGRLKRGPKIGDDDSRNSDRK